MTDIVTDVGAASAWLAEALSSSGYRADFTPSSLWEIDRFFEDQTKKGKPRRRGLLALDTGSRVFALGAYMGEVIRRELGGEWRGDDDDPEVEINVELHYGNGDGVCWPVQRAMKRLVNGGADSVAAWGAGIGVEVGPRPDRT